jgi:nucleotide-binding universal stress UspA family protein
MFERPLICTDLTDGLQKLVNFIPSLAAGGMRQLVFLHTVPLRDEVGVPTADAAKVAAAQAKLTPSQVPTGIEVKVEVQSGKAIDAILNTIKTYNCDAIILGSQTRNTLTEKLFGSTMTTLTERTQLPLLALRPPLISTYTADELNLRCRHLFRDLLVPYDGSRAAQQTIERIKAYASSQTDPHLRSCTLCWVTESGGRTELSDAEQQTAVQQTVEPVRADLQALGLRVEIDVRRGNVVEQLLIAAQEADISAIALSSNSLNRFMEWSSPSAATDLLRRSWHPVLFFPPAR